MKECVTHHHACDCREEKFAKLEADLALPEDSKTVNAELYGLAMEFADEMVVVKSNWPRRPDSRALRYLELREASGEPMPYKVVRDGDKVRFDKPDPPKDGE